MTAIYVWTLAAVMFVLELAMVGVLGYAGLVLAGRGLFGWPAAAGAVIAVALVWALFAAPAATFDIGLVKAVVKVALFAAAAVVLWQVAHRPDLAAAFAVLALVVNIAAVLPPYSTYGGFDVPA
ncbi:DUF2568 domain-containing protein [Gordonia neofelifaecis]|uniref:Uncharacterized protein n=1 Tax=Gordonia neofelifaecis NRRL B-59395 TaxID=644548 RepID=F1YEP9_9ACTN|nr:DUF2568 domain-containing protein [Gordonia neofelifaecis]EGD56882.1 hypothetical protein SCNU_00850 [Gordonia neofelifaecis NRRL B-59395]